jgi:hypothetical protein
MRIKTRRNSNATQKADFNFETFRTDGDSGALYLATRKADGKKFIVKHELSDCACNEFLYYSIAKELGLKTLEFNLFEQDKKGDLFKSRYAIAIEYIKGASHLKNISTERGGLKNEQEYFSHFALFAAFIEEDGLEILADKDGFIYRIDPTESFGINYFIINTIQLQAMQDHVVRMIRDMEERVYKRIREYGDMIKGKYTDYSIYKATLKRLSEIEPERIDEIVDEVCKVYPKGLADYYVNFLLSCQAACEKNLNEK